MPSWKKVVVDGTSPSFSQITTTDITASGNISASGNVAGDVYLSKGIAAFTYNDPSLIFGNASYSTKLQGTNVLLSGQVTASGNISSSEDVLFKRLFISNERFVSNDGNDNVIGTGTHPTAINGAVGSSGYAVKISGETLFENNITASGNISASGQLIAASADFKDGNITNVGEISVDKIKSDDAGCQMEFQADAILTEGADITFNDGNDDKFFRFKGSGDDNLIYANHNNVDRVGIGIQAPTSKLQVTGDFKVSTNITASGNISASGT